MAISRVTTWASGQTLTASALNAEFNNIINNGTSLWSPATASVSMGGYALVLDAAGVSSVQSSGSSGFLYTAGDKSGSASTTGSSFNIAAATFTDTGTAGSGTATAWVATYSAGLAALARPRAAVAWLRFSGCCGNMVNRLPRLPITNN